MIVEIVLLVMVFALGVCVGVTLTSLSTLRMLDKMRDGKDGER